MHTTGVNWPEMDVLIVYKYDNSGLTANVGGVSRKIPSHFIRLAFMGSDAMQVFCIPNVDPDPEEHQNFLFYRSTVEEALEGTGVAVRVPKPLTWDTPLIYICSKRGCGHTFSSLQEREIHFFYAHPCTKNGVIKCPSCMKVSTAQSELEFKEHVYTHRPFPVCEVCGKCYFNKAKLKRHRDSVHDPRNYVCNVCGKVNPSSSNHARHVAIHEERVKLKCNHCPKEFTSNCSLGTHMRRTHPQFLHDGVEATLFNKSVAPQNASNAHRPKRARKVSSRPLQSIEFESLMNENATLWDELERLRHENDTQSQEIVTLKQENENQRKEILYLRHDL